MDHRTALRLRAAERYPRGELSPEQRDAFEDHYFDCPECAAAVLFEQVFAANARAALLEELASGAPGSGHALRD